MKRLFFSLLVLFAPTATLFAQKPSEPVQLTVHPANLPQPSLKYRLLPGPGELTNGNAPTQYYRALSLFVENPGLLSELRADYWENWLNMPLKELPRKEADEKLHMARHVIRELDIGSKRKQCDWQLEGRSEGIGLIIPDVQSFRIVARPLAVCARLAIANGNYAEACAMLQIGYGLARHLGQGPTLIHVLVGMAIANMMTNQLETLIQQPDAPNLYWSLTVLPRPFADLQPALYGETVWVENMFPWLKTLDSVPMSEEQVKAFEAKIKQVTQDFGLRDASVGQRVTQALALTEATAEGKRDLVERYKIRAEQVAAMPSAQVAALYSSREYKESIEEIVKWSHVPEGWKYPAYQRAQQRYGKAVKRLDALYFRGLLFGLGDTERFPLERVSLSAARVDRRLAALRCIESLRNHAAKHDGKLPATLADVTDLPIPNDPLTNKPFHFAVNGDKATLSLANPVDAKAKPLLTYYVTLKRGKE